MKDMISHEDARALTGTTLIVSMVRFARTSEAGNAVYKGRAGGATIDIIVPPNSMLASTLAKVEALKTSALVEGSVVLRAYTNAKGEPCAGATFVTVDNVRVVEPRRKDVSADVSALRAIAAKSRWSESDKT